MKILLLVIAAYVLLPLPSFAQLNAKDMFYQDLKSGTHNSVAYCLELRRGSAKPVLCNNRFPFKTGDAVRIHLKTTSLAYAYITLAGSSGKKVVLYPPPGGNQEDNRLTPGKEYLVPPCGEIVFDNQPGTEHLSVVLARESLSDPRVFEKDGANATINGDYLNGMPQRIGEYEVLSNDGYYEPGQKAPGAGLVFVSNPDPSRPTVISLALTHVNDGNNDGNNNQAVAISAPLTFEIAQGLAQSPSHTETKTKTSKCDIFLQLLLNEIASTGGRDLSLRNEALRIFSIKDGEQNPDVKVCIVTDGSVSEETLARAGARNCRRFTDTLFYAKVSVRSLSVIEQLVGVKALKGYTAVSVPEPPKRSTPATTGGGRELIDLSFDAGSYKGKGAIVAVIDTGIDWRHPDFVRQDGTSRILYLYDPSDDSWKTSKGSIGKPGPLTDTAGNPIGTLYTRDQITAALSGKGTVNSYDEEGHGTACAATAAANGNAPGGFKGVAPEADIIAVAFMKAQGDINYVDVAKWVSQQAQEIGKPCVMNMSFGNQVHGHDGHSAGEESLNTIVGPGKPGLAICVAAGNDGEKNIHASGRFGPKRAGQLDPGSRVIDLVAPKKTPLFGYFSPDDDWALVIFGGALVSAESKPGAHDGKPLLLIILKSGESYYKTADKEIYTGKVDGVEVYSSGDLGQAASVAVILPGSAEVYHMGSLAMSEKVSSGRFDLYSWNPQNQANFAQGMDRQFMVGSPGNAKNVITVGAYNFRSSWQSIHNSNNYVNLPLGEISEYSSPGFCRDGSVKPEIASPASYTISSLARLQDNKTYARNFPAGPYTTTDGFHTAWEGTSAAAPYVAGVVALMLEKNPSLDSDQIKAILEKTARRDEQTGATPNREWGFGKIDPAAALQATPEGKK